MQTMHTWELSMPNSLPFTELLLKSSWVNALLKGMLTEVSQGGKCFTI